jgi:mono/diheme cytochrome c family protein
VKHFAALALFAVLAAGGCPGVASAQDLAAALKRGQSIFGMTCAGYCHGDAGAAGGGPRLSGRGFSQAYVAAVVARGVPGTTMPAFGGSLSAQDQAAVVAYVSTLNGIARPNLAATGPAPAPRLQLSPEATRGRALFSEATRSFARCSTCHEVNGIGIPVAAPIARIPGSAAALRSLIQPGVVTVSVAGETMSALVLSRKAQEVMFYDLAGLPPVLRTVAPKEIAIGATADWRHGAALGDYTDAELSAVLSYLRAIVDGAK